MRSRFYLPFLFIFLIFKIKTSSKESDLLADIFYFDNKKNCHITKNYKTGESFKRNIIEIFVNLVWKTLTKNSIFICTLKKDNLLESFHDRKKILKNDYMTRILPYLGAYENDYVYTGLITDAEKRFLDMIVARTYKIFRSFRICYKDKLDKPCSLLITMKKIINKGICIKSNGINRYPDFHYKWCSDIFYYYDSCFDEKFKNLTVSFARDSKKYISESLCMDEFYELKNFNFTDSTSFENLANAFGSAFDCVHNSIKTGNGSKYKKNKSNVDYQTTKNYYNCTNSAEIYNERQSRENLNDTTYESIINVTNSENEIHETTYEGPFNYNINNKTEKGIEYLKDLLSTNLSNSDIQIAVLLVPVLLILLIIYFFLKKY
ncbi:putative SP-containing membrane protein [Vairimorpha necatrix]|uniref:SP-containing membrane protein n=1 Tax=Vairimorpha necatrix TaxID=6039 RepID=A0AAX4JEH1_9MICR